MQPGKEILAIVASQLKEDKPACVQSTLNRLKASGYSEDRAMHLIARCIVVEIHHVLYSRKPFSEERYAGLLQKLPDEPVCQFTQETCEQILNKRK